MIENLKLENRKYMEFILCHLKHFFYKGCGNISAETKRIVLDLNT